jgi:hypothetical protein
VYGAWAHVELKLNVGLKLKLILLRVFKELRRQEEERRKKN